MAIAIAALKVGDGLTVVNAASPYNGTGARIVSIDPVGGTITMQMDTDNTIQTLPYAQISPELDV